jgi:hypothetical protein
MSAFSEEDNVNFWEGVRMVEWSLARYRPAMQKLIIREINNRYGKRSAKHKTPTQRRVESLSAPDAETE